MQDTQYLSAWKNVVALSGLDTSMMGLSRTAVAVQGPLYQSWQMKWEAAPDRASYDTTPWPPVYEFLRAKWPEIAVAAKLGARHQRLFQLHQQWQLYYQEWLLLEEDFDTVLALAKLPSDTDNDTFRAAYARWRKENQPRWQVGLERFPRAVVHTAFNCESTNERHVPLGGRWTTVIAEGSREQVAEAYATVEEARAGHQRWVAKNGRGRLGRLLGG